ncbi:MAG: fimbrillin family protein [Alistipes sp.]|nr:fimbrillin family protein [Alistipes sp.]
MKNIFKYTICALAALTLTACGGGEGGGKFTEVSFTTEVLSRAAAPNVLTELKSGDRMNIYKTDKSTINLDVMEVYQATYNGSDWKGTPAITLDGGETAYFFATYPYSAEAVNPLEIPVTVAAQKDVLYSGGAAKATESAPSCTLSMRHAMAVIAFNIKSYVGGKLQSIQFDSQQFPLEGTMRITSGRITATEMGPYTQKCDVSLTPKGWANEHPGALVIPYTAGSAGLPVHLTIDGKSYDIDLPSMTFAMAKKYIFTLILSEAGLYLTSDKPEIINLDAAIEVAPEEQYSHLKMVVNNDSFCAPKLTGTSPYGYIDWGDETVEEYSAEVGTHSYPGKGTFTVHVDAWNAETVTMTGVTGLTELNLSKF